jgi:hypothetical protein
MPESFKHPGADILIRRRVHAIDYLGASHRPSLSAPLRNAHAVLYYVPLIR